MTIYVVIIEDRHTDTEVRLFSTSKKAIAFAEDYLANQGDGGDVHPEDARMSAERLKAAGWLFYGCYSTEGDCV